MRKIRLHVIVAFFSIVGLATNAQNWQETVGAKSFPNSEKQFKIKQQNLKNNTSSIQQVIDECAKAGGGTVVFEAGDYPTGSVFVKENVNLHIGEGVVLKGIQDEAVYPIIKTRVAGIELDWPAGIVNVMDVKNAAITGSGKIDGQGKYFWDQFWEMFPEYDSKGLRWALDYDCQRPRGVLIQNSENITIKDITIQEPGFWTVHILYSTHVTVDGVIIRNNINGHGPSSDGIDIDSSSKILVQNCDIDCNDDNFCLKAGKDADGLRVNRPTEYVVIRDCVSRAGHGLLTFGSETSGGINHIEAYNLDAVGTLYGIRLKSAKTRGGIIEDVYIHDIKMNDVFVPIRGTLNWFPKYSYSILPDDVTEVPEHWKVLSAKVSKKKGIPTFRNFIMERITALKSGSAIELEGLEKSYLQNFTFKDVNIDCKRPGYIRYGENFTFEGTTIDALSNEAVTEESCKNFNWIYEEQ